MFPSTLLAALALIALVSVPTLPQTHAFDPNSPYPYLTPGTFASIKNTPAERLVLFFHSSPTAATTLAALNTVARRLHSDLPHVAVQYCNGSEPANAADFQAAGFGSGEWLFTSTPGEGIMKYTGPVTAAELVDHVRHKYLASEASDLVKFTTEEDFYALLDAPPALPIFVKFFEPWCEHCKRLAPTFAISATYFRTAVRHVAVQCSGSTDATDFCQRHAVHSYPVVMLFDGERTVRYEGEERSVRAFDGFFEAQLSGYDSPVKAARRQRAARKGQAAEVDGDVEEAGSGVVEAVGQKSALEKPRVAKGLVEKAEATPAKSEKRTRVDVEKPAQSVKASAQTEPSVAERLSALEKEVGEMHSTLRAIEQQLTKLVAQRH